MTTSSPNSKFQWLGSCVIAFIFIFALSAKGQSAPSAVTVTITQKVPVEIVSATGAMMGIKESTIGAKLTWVSSQGPKITLQDAQGGLYRITTTATDYVAPTPVASSAPTTGAASAPAPATQTPAASAPTAAAPSSAPVAGNSAAPDFGPNVMVFDSTMAPADIQSKCDEVFQKEERSEFGTDRYAFLFKPGSYQQKVKVGFYTQVYGLGKLPDDVTINGEVSVNGDWMDGNCTDNFWRGAENLSIQSSNDMWAVSQAAPFRRIHVKGALELFQVHNGAGGWASGGFMADCKIDGRIVPGSQQQWFSRNSDWSDWTNGVWNMVFLGVTKPPSGTWPAKPYTTIDKTPIIAEKPFLYVDSAGQYNVFVPALKKDAVGITWGDGNPAGTSIPISQFYIARADNDSSATINAALAGGKNLLLTPGIYHLDSTIQVTRPDTIVLGLGMATLFPEKGTSAMEVADVSGVKIANILFDAGAVTSPVLLQMGEPGSHLSHADDPSFLYDVFCRVGGAAVGVAKTCVVINSNDVVGDHAWIWRADHGAGSAWDQNKSTNGLIVNGANVTYYGLFVEHFQEDQTLWNGDNGRVYFYQCEMPYDPPTQTAWQHGNVKGYPGYKVADGVKTHAAWGMGIYCVFKQDNIYSDVAVEAPKSPGVQFHDVLTFRLSGATDQSGINSVINGTGDPSTKKATKQMVIEYPGPANS